jgi:hypothetical protein
MIRLADILATGKRKYGNKSTVIDGHSFASKAEASRYRVLKLLASAKRITELKLQPVFQLAPAVTLSGRRKPALRYIGDFSYRDEDGDLVVEDVKGAITDVYRIKKHLMKSVHGIEIQEIPA